MVEYESAHSDIQIISKEFGNKGALIEIEGTEEKLEKLYGVLGRSIRRV
jgi:hypothetical protein